MPTRKWGSEKLVNTTTAGYQTASKVAALSGGRFVVVWQDESGEHPGIRGQLFDTAGNRVGAEIPIIVGAGNDEILPDVTGMADGGFYVTWTQLVGTTNYILGSVYDANGMFVHSQPVIFANDQHVSNSVVTKLGTGSAVAWYDPDSTAGDIEFRVLDATGAGTGVLVANNGETAHSQLEPYIAASTNQSMLAIVWTDQSQSDMVRVRVFNAAGNPIEPPIRVDQTNPGFLIFAPRVVWLSNTEFVVTWSGMAPVHDFNILMRIYTVDNGGVYPLTDPVQVNAPSFGGQFQSAVTALPNGGFVVSWKDESTIGVDGDTAIKLQAFDGKGSHIGGEITVNTTTTNSQLEPSLSALPDGRVVVTWTDYSATGGDKSGSAIRMQIVDPRDGIVTGTSGSETLYGHDLVNDEISAGAGDDKLYGMRGDDALYGGDGNDMLNGGIGADAMYGGADNDTYYVDNVGDEATENTGEGSDTVYSNINYTLAVGSAVEFLRANAGATGLTLAGNELANTIVGGTGSDTLIGAAGNDVLKGGLGADTLIGGKGNDTYYVDAADVVTELANEGSDTVYAAIDYTLGAGWSIEFLRANAGSVGLTLTGNALSNTMVGGMGNDALAGGDGNDTFNGSAGADLLTGGNGADIFKIAASTDSTVVVGGRDTIKDFSSAAGDKIDLHLIDANTTLAGDQAFAFIGANAFTGKLGEVRYASSGGDTLISGELTGDKSADFSILVTGVHTFITSDFVL